MKLPSSTRSPKTKFTDPRIRNLLRKDRPDAEQSHDQVFHAVTLTGPRQYAFLSRRDQGEQAFEEDGGEYRNGERIDHLGFEVLHIEAEHHDVYEPVGHP